MSIELRNRRGKVNVTTVGVPRQPERRDITVEGTLEAVLVYVAQRLEGCTQCYEHMFHCNGIAPMPDGTFRAFCQSNDYAGD